MKKIKSSYLLDQICSFGRKKYEIALLAPILMDEDLLIVQPKTQFKVDLPGGNYRLIDLYYEDIKLAIEIDEEGHTGKEEIDAKRESEIIEKLGCEFFRIKTKTMEDLWRGSSSIKSSILKKVEDLRSKGNFSEWRMQGFKLEEAATHYPNMLFYKLNDNERPYKISNIFGPIRLKQDLRAKVDHIAVLSGNSIVQVFSVTDQWWDDYPEKQKGIYIAKNYTPIPNHPLIYSGITNMPTTTNRVLGINLDKNYGT